MANANLVSAAELAAHVADPAWCVFDCRHDLRNIAYGSEAYGREHIPGARFLHLDRDLSGPMTGTNGRHPLPEPGVLAARLGACGVGPDTRVVAYDNEGGVFAARLWWLLRWLGHDNVAILDGGLAAWKRAKQPLEAAVPDVVPAGFPLCPRPAAVVALGEVQACLSDPAMLLLDARAEDRFAGQNETLDPVGGHIPGALNRFFMDNLDDNGLNFKPVAELRAEFEALLAGRDPATVVHSCGSGVTACHNLLAMEEAGLSGSRLYAGSWSEWCSDPARPVER